LLECLTEPLHTNVLVLTTAGYRFKLAFVGDVSFALPSQSSIGICWGNTYSSTIWHYT